MLCLVFILLIRKLNSKNMEGKIVVSLEHKGVEIQTFLSPEEIEEIAI